MNGEPVGGLRQLQEDLRQAQRERSEAQGMLQITQAKLQDAEEDMFDLRASMAAFEAETVFSSNQSARAMQNKAAALESKLAFMQNKFEITDRVKLRAIKEVQELKEVQQRSRLERSRLEHKRLDAEKRLMATKRRKHDSFLAASQSLIFSQQASQSSQQIVRPVQVPVVETAVQTELKLADERGEGSGGLKEENARLVAYLLTGTSRDLLTLLNGTVTESPGEEKTSADDVRTQPHQGCHSSTPSQFFQESSSNSLNDSMQQSSSGVQFSQSVFSQMAVRASAQAHASLLSVARETTAAQTTLAMQCARELYDVIGKMLAGDVSAVALVPVITNYLAAPTDLEWIIICSVLRVMYAVMHHSTHFQHFLLVASSSSNESLSSNGDLQRGTTSMDHPRITLAGLHFTSLDEYLSARSDNESVIQSDLVQLSEATEQRQLRSKLMSALCRVIKNNLKEPAVVKDGLSVLCCWVDFGLTPRPALTPDFKPLLAANVIPAILLAPKGLPAVKAQAVRLLSQLLRVPEVFAEVETESKKSLLFNRCAKMLACERILSPDEASDVRTLQHQIVKLLLSIITSFPSVGIRFVLEGTRGLPSDSDGHRSVIYYLAQLLHRQTFDARTASAGGESCGMQQLLSDPFHVDLIQDAFALLVLLSRYVDLQSELNGDDQAQTFLAVLYFLTNVTQADDGTSIQNDSIAASARALVAMMNLPGQ